LTELTRKSNFSTRLLTNNQLLNRIRKLKEEGNTKDEIYLTLLTEGYSVDDISQAFEQVQPTAHFHSEYDKLTNWAIYFGFILIALSAILFVGSNWKYFSPLERVALLISGLVGSQALGCYLLQFESKRLNVLGKGFIILGLGLFGANVFLLAQIFNLPVSWTEGTQVWLLGALAIFYFFDFKMLRWALLLLLISVTAILGLATIIQKKMLISYTPVITFVTLVLLLWASFVLSKSLGRKDVSPKVEVNKSS